MMISTTMGSRLVRAFYIEPSNRHDVFHCSLFGKYLRFLAKEQRTYWSPTQEARSIYSVLRV